MRLISVKDFLDDPLPIIMFWFCLVYGIVHVLLMLKV